MSSPSWDSPSSSANPTVDDEDLEREELEREQIEALERELLEQLERDQIEAPDGDQFDALEKEQREEQLEREQIEALEREQSARMERERIEREQIARERTEREQVEREQIEALEREQREEQLEREQIEALERVQLAQMGQLDAADIEASEQSEREQLDRLERESLEQLERLERQQNPSVAAPPRPSPPPGPTRPVPSTQTGEAPSAPVADEGKRPGIDAAARAAQFLAAANERQALLDEAAGGVQPSAPPTERRELNEPARAARAIVEHRHRNLVEANALLTEARRVLAPMAYRGISDRAYRRRKVILGIGEAVSLAIAFSAAFDVAPLEGLLLSGAIALAFVIAGDLGGVLRLAAERSRLSAALEDDVVHLDPRYLHILYHDRQPWLSIVGGVTAAVFALATVSVGVLRAANQGSLGLAAGLGLLTVSLAIAAGLSSWQHASLGSEIIDHLQREEQAAARRLKRAAAARVLRRPQIMTVVGTEEFEMPLRAPEVDWQMPDVDWQAPIGETPARRPKRAGRAARAGREKPAKREKSSGSGLVGAAAARGAVFLATLPAKLRRPEDAVTGPKKASKKESKRESKIEDMSVSGDGPGALGESAGPISSVTFTPPVRTQKKFGSP